MKISIVTTFFNAETTIADTIKSVKGNSSDKFQMEYILIDSCSTDNSLDIVRELTKGMDNVIIISEKDDGIYDGMNKGLTLSSGDIIGILNADDFLAQNTLAHVYDLFLSEPDAGLVAGSITRVNDDIKSSEFLVRSCNSPLKLGSASVHHPAIFVRSDVYKQLGYFNPDFRISADYEFISRCLSNGVKVIHSDENFTFVREGGCSEKIDNLILKNVEQLKIGWRYSSSSKASLLVSSVIKFSLHFVSTVKKSILYKENSSSSAELDYINKYRWF